MTIKIAAGALAALLLAGSVRAEDAKPAPTAKESVMTFFKHLILNALGIQKLANSTIGHH